jgi:hypothetical protein
LRLFLSRHPQNHVAKRLARAAQEAQPITALSSQMNFSPRSLVLFSCPTLPSGSVRAIASNASTLIAMRTLRGHVAAMKASDAANSIAMSPRLRRARTI